MMNLVTHLELYRDEAGLRNKWRATDQDVEQDGLSRFADALKYHTNNGLDMVGLEYSKDYPAYARNLGEAGGALLATAGAGTLGNAAQATNAFGKGETVANVVNAVTKPSTFKDAVVSTMNNGGMTGKVMDTVNNAYNLVDPLISHN